MTTSQDMSQDQRNRLAEQVRDQVSNFLEERFSSRQATSSEIIQSVKTIPVERLLQTEKAGSKS